jgi:alkylation response protein AidB-like acyl-CoA dehydrogenase
MEDFMPGPLTALSEDEQMFKEMLDEIAADQVAPKVAEMDASAKLDADIPKMLFEQDLMGIEIPEKFGGAEQTFFMSCLAVERLSKVDPSVGVLTDVQNTLVNNAFLRWGNEAILSKYLPLLATERVGAYALSEAGLGLRCFCPCHESRRQRQSLFAQR